MKAALRFPVDPIKIFLTKKSNPEAAKAAPGQHIKSLAEFASADAKTTKFIFGRGMYVDKNTSRPANVNFGGEDAKTLRCSESQPFVEKTPVFSTAYKKSSSSASAASAACARTASRSPVR